MRRAKPDKDIFQFTTSQGGRLKPITKNTEAMTFQFTTSQGGRPGTQCTGIGKDLFQFTTSQGGRQDSD